MLGVVGVASGSGRYYVEDLARELDAALLDAGGPGRVVDGHGGAQPDRCSLAAWCGPGAHELGLVGTVRDSDLSAVLQGKEPRSGRLLRERDVTVRAFDLTFSAPKSVSVAFGLCGPGIARGVLDAHMASVASAMDYVSRCAVAARRTTSGERLVVPVGGVIAASFTHGISRAHDPHLHTHAVVANLVLGGDGRWSAIDSRGIYAHKRAAGALYDAALRHGVTSAIGCSWTRRASGGYEIDGIDPMVLGMFSSRRADIEAHLFDRGGALIQSRHSPTGRTGPSSASLRIAWAKTRDPKRAVTGGSLCHRWTDQLRSQGLAAPLEIGRVAHPRALGPLDEHHFSSIVSQTPHGGVRRRDALSAWASSVREGSTVGDVERCVDQLAPWGRGVGVDEETVAPSPLVASRQALRILGPRPTTPLELEHWRSGARALERYGSRWPISDVETSGRRTRSSTLSRMPARQLAAYLEMTREVSLARRAIGRSVELRDTPGSDRSWGR